VKIPNDAGDRDDCRRMRHRIAGAFAYLDDRDPGDEDRSNAFAAFRGAGFAAELEALADVETTPAVEVLIRKLAEGKLK
jgi:hypothetical protein